MTDSSGVSRLTSYLITGGCGFIGVNLVANMLEENPSAKIRVLDNLSVGTRKDLSDVCNYIEVTPSSLTPNPSASVELIVGDIKDFEICRSACEGVNTVVHLAANTGVAPSVENPREDMETNVIGTFNMLEASRRTGVQKFIFASSAAPLGEVDPPFSEQKAPRPVSPYGASKLAGEGYCSAYNHTFGIKTISLRFGNVYGPRSKHKNSVVAKFFKQAFEGKALEIYGDGEQTRDFIYIDDLNQAIMLSVKADIGGEVFQIATYNETTVNEIAGKIKELVEKEIKRDVQVIYSESRLGDVRKSLSDISKARKMLGYKPRFDLDKGLRNTFKCFR
jgi:UDP-glucose 4-epimerase